MLHFLGMDEHAFRLTLSALNSALVQRCIADLRISAHKFKLYCRDPERQGSRPEGIRPIHWRHRFQVVRHHVEQVGEHFRIEDQVIAHDVPPRCE
jgi:hypothetical protein